VHEFCVGHPSLLKSLAERLNQVQRQIAHFHISDLPVLKNLDSIYKEIISDLGPKIQVNGTPALSKALQ
jgi:high frequency lysogenization protein